MNKVRSREGDTVGLILWLALQRYDDEAEEMLYQLNPGIEEYGAILPAGVEITLPELPDKAPEQVVNIWD